MIQQQFRYRSQKATINGFHHNGNNNSDHHHHNQRRGRQMKSNQYNDVHEKHHNMEWKENQKQEYSSTDNSKQQQQQQQQRDTNIETTTTTTTFTVTNEIDTLKQSRDHGKKRPKKASITIHDNPLMIICTKPSQISSLHPAVRLALLHDQVQIEYAKHNASSSSSESESHVTTSVDPNIWY